MFKPHSPQKGCDHVTECVDRPCNVVIVVVVVVVVVVAALAEKTNTGFAGNNKQ